MRTTEQINDSNLCLDYYKLKTDCKKHTNAYGSGEGHRISRDGKIVSRLDCGGGFYRITTMGKCENKEKTYFKWRDLNNSIFAKAQRENAPTLSEDADNKPTPIIDKWDKGKCYKAERWADRFSTKKCQTYNRWNSSKDGGTQSFVSIKDNMLHFDLITRYPDFDIPEDGMNEIYAVVEKAHAEIDAIVKARLEYWREEERNGRL